ncbi:MAG TPA: hypothetical protein PLD59_12680 [Tepidisphaeraceae bacterium]|nr:hypothetical protein [Tepidisphaeraceae bacterium]
MLRKQLILVTPQHINHPHAGKDPRRATLAGKPRGFGRIAVPARPGRSPAVGNDLPNCAARIVKSSRFTAPSGL